MCSFINNICFLTGYNTNLNPQNTHMYISIKKKSKNKNTENKKQKCKNVLQFSFQECGNTTKFPSPYKMKPEDMRHENIPTDLLIRQF